MHTHSSSPRFTCLFAIALTAILAPISLMAQPGKGNIKPKKIKASATSSAPNATHQWHLSDTLGMNGYVSALMAKMTLEEKIGQLNLPTVGFDVTGPVLSKDVEGKIQKGLVGGVFNTFTPVAVRKLQEKALKETRLGIPLLFGFDVIHGHRTIFPIPLGLSCTWNMNLIQNTAQVAATEASTDGLNWTFSPMVDIARDPRWGRVSEGAGEDPFLGSAVGAAMVRGYQGAIQNTLNQPTNIMACVKHFGLYGAAEAGRDYNTVDMSEYKMYNDYFPPYRACVAEGVGSAMASFNDINGMPATCNRWLLTDVLRKEWGFNGMVCTDYTGIAELINHGMGDESTVAKRSLNAGSDMDMVSELFLNKLPELVNKGIVPVSEVDLACRRILNAKYRLGLFSDPYRGLSVDAPARVHLSNQHRDIAYQAAVESFVLLQNDWLNDEPKASKYGQTTAVEPTSALPLSPDANIAWIGPYIKDKRNLIGNWSGAGDYKQAISLWEALHAVKKWDGQALNDWEKRGWDNESNYALGCNALEDEALIARLNEHGGMIEKSAKSPQALIDEAVALAKTKDVVVVYLGETFGMSGEAASRSNIQLPENQKALLRALAATGKPIVLLLMNGRPLDLSEESKLASSILVTWFAGTQAGLAVRDVLFGKVSPSGKLTMTFPRSVGQVPIYYNAKNTGRPFDEKQKYTSKYLDIQNTPLFAFGHGLSYGKTALGFGGISVNSDTLVLDARAANAQVEFDVVVLHVGGLSHSETIQLYTHQRSAMFTRPVKELKRFQKMAVNVEDNIRATEHKAVTFTLGAKDFSYFDESGKPILEAGLYDVWIGTASDQLPLHKVVKVVK
ncbi:MAG: beta-glucosidase BglX [Bacteroidota bacterium]